MHKPDLILLDLDMPKKDLRKALSEIVAETYLKGILLVLFTGSSSCSERGMVQKAEAGEFFTKPNSYVK